MEPRQVEGAKGKCGDFNEHCVQKLVAAICMFRMQGGSSLKPEALKPLSRSRPCHRSRLKRRGSAKLRAARLRDQPLHGRARRLASLRRRLGSSRYNRMWAQRSAGQVRLPVMSPTRA